MKHYSDDELDQALFALPLEETPADLRGAILAATCYRPPAMFKVWEVSLLGAGFAVVAWLVWMLASGGLPRFTQTVANGAEMLGRAMSDPTLALWLAIGAGAAVWLSLGANQTLPTFGRTARR